jgi:hypothetical protein
MDYTLLFLHPFRGLYRLFLLSLLDHHDHGPQSLHSLLDLVLPCKIHLFLL